MAKNTSNRNLFPLWQNLYRTAAFNSADGIHISIICMRKSIIVEKTGADLYFELIEDPLHTLPRRHPRPPLAFPPTPGSIRRPLSLTRGNPPRLTPRPPSCLSGATLRHALDVQTKQYFFLQMENFTSCFQRLDVARGLGP